MSEKVFENIASQLRKPLGEDGRQVGEKMNITNVMINRRTIEELHITQGDKILELGMGNGFFVKEILEKADNVHYTGCDYPETMIAEAVEINKQFISAGSADFYYTTADKLPFDDAAFDKVFGINIIYFWENPARELAEIRRVLKPGGKLLISIRPKETMQQYPFTRYGFIMYSEEELTDFLSKNGFMIKNMVAEDEPDQELNGIKIKVDMLIAIAEKVA